MYVSLLWEMCMDDKDGEELKDWRMSEEFDEVFLLGMTRKVKVMCVLVGNVHG